MRAIHFDKKKIFNESINYEEYRRKIGEVDNRLNESVDQDIENSIRLDFEQMAWEAGPHFVLESGTKIPAIGSKVSGRRTLNHAASICETAEEFLANVQDVVLEGIELSKTDLLNLEKAYGVHLARG